MTFDPNKQQEFGQAGYQASTGGAAPYAGQPSFDPQAYAQAAASAQQNFSAQMYQPVLATQKSMIAAALLAFFVGTLGVHNFYLGHTGRGIAQLVLTLTVIGFPISALWAFVEFILILLRSGRYAYDASGIPLN